MDVIVAFLDTYIALLVNIIKKNILISQKASPKKESQSAIWSKNEFNQLTEFVRDSLASISSWLNNNLMDTGQQPICRVLNSLESHLELSRKGINIFFRIW